MSFIKAAKIRLLLGLLPIIPLIWIILEKILIMHKNVIITGGSKGIGKAIALELAGAGFNIAICSRNGAEGNQLIAELQNINAHGQFKAFVCDVRIKQEVVQFASLVKDFFENKIDVLINNAGTFIPGLITEEEEGNLEKMIETNLYSAYHLTRELIGIMQHQKSGHVINMCSIASEIAYPNGGSYSISKFALLGFSKVLREEMKPYNVKVTSILPGATWSDSWKGVDLPESRLMQAEDIAKIVLCALTLSDSATLEEITVRPQLGDL